MLLPSRHLVTGAPVSLRTRDASTKRPACWMLLRKLLNMLALPKPLLALPFAVWEVAALASAANSSGPSSSGMGTWVQLKSDGPKKKKRSKKEMKRSTTLGHEHDAREGFEYALVHCLGRWLGGYLQLQADRDQSTHQSVTSEDNNVEECGVYLEYKAESSSSPRAMNWEPPSKEDETGGGEGIGEPEGDEGAE